MEKILHDYVIIEPSQDQGVLKSLNENINSGIVKGAGEGVHEYGEFIPVEVKNGDTVLFTQHLQIEDNGEKIYIVRHRDIIRVSNDSTT